MRVTNLMLVDTVINNLQQNAEALDRVQNQVSSGKRVTRPADDPVAAGLGVRLRNERAADNQFLRNIEQTRTWLGTTDQALGEVGSTLARIRELAVRAANDTYAPQDRVIIGKEVEQLRMHLMATMNATISGDQYIFGGMKTYPAPFSLDVFNNVVYGGDGNVISREIAPGTMIAVNVPGSSFMTMFTDVQTLSTTLATNPPGTPAAINATIASLDSDINFVLASRADVGAKLNRLDLTQSRMGDLELEVGRLQSTNEDLDFADALTRLTTQQSVYRASLEAGARTAPMSLLDFLH